MKWYKILFIITLSLLILSCSIVPAPQSGEMGILMFQVKFPELAKGESDGKYLDYAAFIEFINTETNKSYSYYCKNYDQEIDNIKIIYNIPSGLYIIKKVEFIAEFKEDYWHYIPILVDKEATTDITGKEYKFIREKREKHTRKRIIIYYDSIMSKKLPQFTIVNNKILMLGTIDIKIINKNSDLMRYHTMVSYIKRSDNRIFYILANDFLVSLVNNIDEYKKLVLKIIEQKKITDVWKGAQLVFFGEEEN